VEKSLRLSREKEGMQHGLGGVKGKSERSGGGGGDRRKRFPSVVTGFGRFKVGVMQIGGRRGDVG